MGRLRNNPFAHLALQLLLTLVLLGRDCSYSQTQPFDTAKLRHDLSEGQYEKALMTATSVLQTSRESVSGDDLAVALEVAVAALVRLNRVDEIDAFLEENLKQHATQPVLLCQASRQYVQIEHQGYKVSGAFHRGYARDGAVQYANAYARDRAMALRLALAAIDLSEGHPMAQRVVFFKQLAEVLSTLTPAWKLQQLTNPSILPDYEEQFYGWDYSNRSLGAPTDPEGNPIFFALPLSRAEAKSDGELWRWALRQTEAGDSWYEESALASFSLRHFGTQTLGGGYSALWGDGDVATDKQKAIFQLDSLADDETLARLASGVKRFHLPDDYNYISLFKKLSEQASHALNASVQLAQVYENRRQFESAATYWRAAIKLSPHYKSRLEQITANLGRFELLKPQLAEVPAELDFVFRNGRQADFEVVQVNFPALIEDLRNFLAQRPKQLDYRRVDFHRLGQRLTEAEGAQFLGKVVAQWSENLEPRENHFDRRVTVKVPPLPGGIYLVRARMKDGNLSQTLLWLQELVVVKKLTDQGPLYFVAEAATGKPVSKAKLQFIGYSTREDVIGQVTGALLGGKPGIRSQEFSKETDENGIVQLGTRELNSDFTWLTLAEVPEKFPGLLNFSWNWDGPSANEQEEQLKPYLITDRPVYRPGQKVKFKVWMGRGNYRFEDEDLSGRSLTLVIRNARQDSVLSQVFQTDKFGGFSGELALPADAALGTYWVSLPGYANPGSFRVEEYKKPEFEVLVESPKEGVLLGEPFRAKVRARYYYGEPVSSGKVRIKVERTPFETRWYPSMPWDWLYGPGYWWFASDYQWFPGWRDWGCRAPLWFWFTPQGGPAPELVQEQELAITPQGEIDFSVDTALAKALHDDTDHRYRISVEVTDASRRMISGSGEVVASRKPFQVFAWTDKGFYRVGDTVKTSIQARAFASGESGSPVVTTGDVRLLRVTSAKDGGIEEQVVREASVSASADGRIEIDFSAAKPGQYRVSAKLKDSRGREVEGGYLFSIYGDTTDSADFRSNDLELIPEQREYSPGSNALVSVSTKLKSSWVLLFERARQGEVSKPRLLQLGGAGSRVTLPIAQGDMPNFYIEAVSVQRGAVFSQVREIVVPPQERILDAKVTTDKEEYKPGETAHVRLSVRDVRGNPFSGSVVLSAYDRALDYISGGTNVPNIKEFFWKWRRRHHVYGTNSTQLLSYNLLVSGDLAMQAIGAFGYAIFQDGDMPKSPEGRVMGQGLASRSMDAAQSVGGGFLAGADEKSAVAAAMPASIETDSLLEANAEASESGSVRTEFADTALWVPSIDTDSKGEATTEFVVPDNLTSWKIRAWTLGMGTRVGESSKEVVSKKDVLLRLQAPRFLVEKDQVVLSANLHNYTSAPIKARALLEIDSRLAFLDSQVVREVQLEPQGESRVDWRVRAVSPGEATIRAKLVSEAGNDGMESKLPVLVHGAERTESWSGYLRRGVERAELKLAIPEERHPEKTNLEIRVSPSLALAMVDALPYLTDYPYGCTEQTLNRFLPTVLTNRALRDLGVNLEELKKEHSNLNAQEIGDPQRRAQQWRKDGNAAVFDQNEVDKRTRAGLQRLESMQLSDGGWGWFSGWGEQSSPHTTALVVHGLWLAKGAGQSSSANSLSRGISWLKSYQAGEIVRLKKTSSDPRQHKERADNVDAFVHSVLTEVGSPSSGMSEFLYRDRGNLSLYSELLLAEALHRDGNLKRRDELLTFVKQYVVEDEENQTAYLRLGNQGYWWYWYGSETETHAVYLRLLSEVEPKGRLTSWLVKYLLNNRKHATYWKSTRDTALVVEAFARYLRGSGEGAESSTVEIRLDGVLKKSFSFTPGNFLLVDNTLRLDGKELATGSHTLEIRRLGTGPLYFNTYLNNFVLAYPIQPAGLEIKVERDFYKLVATKEQGQTPGTRGQVVSAEYEKYVRTQLKEGDLLTSGDLVEVELSVESKNDYEYIALEDPKAAGLEPMDVRSGYNGNPLGAYVEFRDQKVIHFMRTLPRGKRSLAYRLRAEAPGIFHALPSQIYGMYAPELRGNAAEMRVQVRD